MIKAILYTSNTGTTAQYAAMLGEKTGLPVYPLSAATAVQPGTEVLYLGWVMASGVQGYKKAAQCYHVCAVCGVCMGATGSQLAELRKANAIPDGVPVFTLQGGFDIHKLHGIYKIMMQLMTKTAGKALAEKENRTEDEDVMLDLMQHGGNRVNAEALGAVLDWFKTQQNA